MAIQTSPIRLGVIGCGNVLSAYRMAIDKLRVHGRVETVIACGRESQRAFACAAHGITRFTTDAMEVIAAPDVVKRVIPRAAQAKARCDSRPQAMTVSTRPCTRSLSMAAR